MLSVVVEKEAAVFVHLVMGEQTRAWKDLHGNVVVNLSAITEGVDPDKPMILSITECEDEAVTADRFPLILHESGGKYPFMPSQRVLRFTDTGKSGKSKIAKTRKKPAKLEGICSRCKRNGPLLSGLKISVCPSCATIDITNAARRDDEKNSTGNDTP